MNCSNNRGIGLFTVVVSIAIISAIVVASLLYLSFSHYKLFRNEMAGTIASYAYEAALQRAYFEIEMNPTVADTIASGNDYYINNFTVGQITMNITITNDTDGDGFFDVDVDII